MKNIKNTLTHPHKLLYNLILIFNFFIKKYIVSRNNLHNLYKTFIDFVF